MRRFVRIAFTALALVTVGLIVDLAYLYHAARATVSGTVTRIVALGNGSNTVFNFPFIGVQASDITVIYTDTSGNQTVLNPAQYTLSLTAAAQGQLWGIGGSVTYPISGTPIAFGTTLTVERVMPLTQTVSSNQGQSFPLSVETALDLLAMQIQQLNDSLSRSIMVGPNDTCSSLGTLPAAATRANQMLGFDSTGCNPIAAQPASALVSTAMQPVVDAPTIAAALTLLGISPLSYVQPCMEADWPSLGTTVPTNWKLESGAAVSRTTYSLLLACLAPVVPCTITSGSATITGIASTAGWGTGWIIESPGSTALTTGQTIASVGGSSVTITGGNASANATSCQIFPYGTAQDGTFALPNAAGVVYAGIDISNTNLNSTYCTGNPAYLNAFCGAQSRTLLVANLPTITPAGTVAITDPGHDHAMGYQPVQDGGINLSVGAGGTPTRSVSETLPSQNTGVNSTGITAAFIGTPFGSATAYSQLPPTRIRNKIIYAGAP